MKSISNIDTFNKQILNGDGLRIVRFCAKWSGPCHIMEPIYEEMYLAYGNSTSFYKIDIDRATSLKNKFGVIELPTILFFLNGEVIDSIVGLVPKDLLFKMMEKARKS